MSDKLDENKVKLEARLFLKELSEKQKKEIASDLKLDFDNKQQDLLYMSAVLVSTGTNKNAATFLGSELIQARGSIINKALDYEHEEKSIIGHIISCMYLNQDGDKVDDFALYNQLSAARKSENISEYNKLVASLDKTELDVGIVCVVYKNRFKDIAEEIDRGEWKVSMECYYRDFDVKVGDLIIPKAQAEKACSNLPVNELVKLVVSGQSLGNHRVSRVLRGIHFCGCGIVKQPANVRSIIMESADKQKSREFKVLEEVQNYMSASESSVELANIEASLEVNLNEDDKFTHSKEGKTKEIIQTASTGTRFLILNNRTGMFISEEADKVKEFKDKASAERYAASNTVKLNQPHSVMEIHGSFSFNDTTNKGIRDYKIITVSDEGEVLKQVEAGSFVSEAGSGGTFGPDDSAAGICISYKKYHYQYNGHANPGEIRAVGWCTQFGKPCPVLGADATAPECLRHRYARLINDDLIHFNASRPEIFNPKSNVGEENIELLDVSDLPSPVEDYKSEQESLENISITKPVGVSIDGLQIYPKAPNGTVIDIRTDDNVADVHEVVEDKEDIKEFIAVVDERAAALSSDVTKFSNSVKEFAEQVLSKNHNYGIPRLRLFPLDSKPAVIAAISRYDSIKADVTSEEKAALFVKIVKAAKIFGLDVGKFIDKVRQR